MVINTLQYGSASLRAFQHCCRGYDSSGTSYRLSTSPLGVIRIVTQLHRLVMGIVRHPLHVGKVIDSKPTSGVRSCIRNK